MWHFCPNLYSKKERRIDGAQSQCVVPKICICLERAYPETNDDNLCQKMRRCTIEVLKKKKNIFFKEIQSNPQFFSIFFHHGERHFAEENCACAGCCRGICVGVHDRYVPACVPVCIPLSLPRFCCCCLQKISLLIKYITIAFHRSHWCLTVSTIWTLASACVFFGLWSSFASFLPSCSRSIHSFPS